MASVQHILDERVTAALRAAYPEAGDAPAVLLPAQDPRFGDYQANGAMALAKRLGRNPREVAGTIVERLDVSDLSETPEIAGPGFINLRLKADWLGARLGEANADERLGVPEAEKPETVVVDYSAPNLAKEMHVGHLRSTIIGDALVRMLDFQGHNVERQNHVGDWGTQFGMLTAYLEEHSIVFSGDDTGNLLIALGLSDLEGLYQRAKREFDGSPAFADKARSYVVKLQSGDQHVVQLWERFVDLSYSHAGEVYKRLGACLTNDDVRGESAYNAVLPDIVEHLRAKGLLTESEGAQCVFLKNEKGGPLFQTKDGDPLPLIVQKSDEGYLYATTDLAALAFRTGRLPEIANQESQIENDRYEISNEKSPKARRILYVVDARQSLHFRMVFECAYQAGFADRAEHDLVHVAFGTMMDEQGKPFKTREGGTVKLVDLLDEAEKRAYDLVTEKNVADAEAGRADPLSEDERKEIAHIVGIGAVKYADLSQNRTSDYVFSWDRMLSLQGNTAPYMQYACARVRSIFRKGGEGPEALRSDASAIPLSGPEERALGVAILRLSEVLDRALDDYRPNVLAAYLYDLAGAFTAFYEACPVLKSDEPTRTARLKLCDLTARTIERGLGLLGIETAERM